MRKRRYVIERLIGPEEYTPHSNELIERLTSLWQETVWPRETSLTWLKQAYGYEYRLVRHGR